MNKSKKAGQCIETKLNAWNILTDECCNDNIRVTPSSGHRHSLVLGTYHLRPLPSSLHFVCGVSALGPTGLPV